MMQSHGVSKLVCRRPPGKRTGIHPGRLNAIDVDENRGAVVDAQMGVSDHFAGGSGGRARGVRTPAAATASRTWRPRTSPQLGTEAFQSSTAAATSSIWSGVNAGSIAALYSSVRAARHAAKRPWSTWPPRVEIYGAAWNRPIDILARAAGQDKAAF